MNVWHLNIWSAAFSNIPLYLLYIKSSFKDDIYERFRADLFTLRRPATCSNYLPPLLRWAGVGWSGLFKFPVCPMRIGAVCPLNLCLKNVTLDSCAALSHPVAHIQCGPVCWGSAEEVSVITRACTTFCTSLPPPPPPPSSPLSSFPTSQRPPTRCSHIPSTAPRNNSAHQVA